jgi:hypothetical protein
MFLIGGVHGRSLNFDSAEDLAREWIRRDDPATTVRFILADGSISHGTTGQMRPVWEALARVRAASE